MPSTLATIVQQLERALTGWLPADVRHNLRIETVASIAYGIFYAIAISFMPVVLRRIGASSSLLAIYTAQTYLGSILATFAVLLIRRYHPLAFAAVCWLLSRSLLLWVFLITDASWLLALAAAGHPRAGLRADYPGDLSRALSWPRASGRTGRNGVGAADRHAAGGHGTRPLRPPGAVSDRRLLRCSIDRS